LQTESETETGRTANTESHGLDLPSAGQSGVVLRRQPAPADDATRGDAARAELLCDVAALCRLRASAPDVVDGGRIRATARRCRPDVLPFADPCLMPQFMLPPEPVSAAPGPTTPTTPGTGGAVTGGGLNLGSLTTFRFSVGPAQVQVDLPASAKATLPVPLSAARRIEFSLDASPSTFSFSARLDGLPDVRIAARAGVDVAKETATAGLTITTTRTVCRAPDPDTARREITAAGEKLTKAVNDWQTPPPVAPGATAPATLDRLTAIGSEVGAMYRVVDRLKRPCVQQPIATFGLGATIPFGPPPAAPERPEPATAGATLTLHF